MTFFTKLVLSKVPFNELASFILKSDKKITTLTTVITYKEVSNFCYMLEQRKLDDTITKLEIFYIPKNTITGTFVENFIEKEDMLSNSDVFFRSTLYPDQNFNITILDGSIMPNVDFTSSVRLRAYAEAQSILSMDTITPILGTSSSYNFINSSILQKEDSAVAPIGFIRSVNQEHPYERDEILAKTTLIVGKINSINKIKFKYKNLIKQDLVVYNITIPFLGTIDILDTKMINSININEGDYLFTRVRGIYGTLLNYGYDKKIHYNQYEIIKYIKERIDRKQGCTSLEGISDYIENNVKTYWDGQLVGTKKETLIEFFSKMPVLFTHHFLPCKDTMEAEITTVREVNFDENFIKDILSVFTKNDIIKNQLIDWIKILNKHSDKALEKKEIRISEEHYSKFIDQCVITMVNVHTRFAYKNILLTFSSKGKIASVEICDFPIFQINRHSPDIDECYFKHIPTNRQDRLIKTNPYPLSLISRNLQVNKKLINIPFDAYMNYSQYINSVFQYINQYIRKPKINDKKILEHPLSFLHTTAQRGGLMEDSMLYCTLPHAFEYFHFQGRDIKYSPYPIMHAEDLANYLVNLTEKKFNYTPFENNKVLKGLYTEFVNLIITDNSTFMEAINYIAMFFLRVGYEESVLTTE